MQSQGHPAAYGQPPSHMTQNHVTNLSHNPHNPIGHPHGNYSLTVPHATQNFSNTNPQAHTPPMNNHMGPNIQHQPIKMVQNNYNQSTTVDLASQEKPRTNGAPEVKVDSTNHVAPKEVAPTALVVDKPSEAIAALPAQASIEAIPPTEFKEKPAVEHLQEPNNSTESSKTEAAIPSKEAGPAKPQAAATPEKNESEVSAKEESTAGSVPKEEVATPEVKLQKSEAAKNKEVVDADEESDSDSKDEEEPKAENITPSAEVPSTPSKSTSSPAKSNSTTPTRSAKKRKASKVDSETSRPSKRDKPSTATAKTPEDDRKSKRKRTRTQHFQSLFPELEKITKIAKSISVAQPKTNDKLIVFYKNEFLAVRNEEGGFFICQSVYNIYKSSLKIKIRWLSQDKGDKSLYTPDFYDVTDFDCILTNLNLERVDKGQFRLPEEERVRTANILKRALAVENGEEEASLSEEHPDGLDVSLYKEESQLKKKGTKRKASRAKVPKAADEKSPKVKKTELKKVKKAVKKVGIPKKSVVAAKKKVTAVVSGSRSDRAKRRQDSSPKTSPVVDQKKAKVLAKVVRKNAIPVSKTAKAAKPAPPKASTSAKSAKAAKPTASAQNAKRSTRK